MTNFVGAGIIPAYTIFAEEFGVTVSEVSYFTSIHVSIWRLHSISHR